MHTNTWAGFEWGEKQMCAAPNFKVESTHLNDGIAGQTLELHNIGLATSHTPWADFEGQVPSTSFVCG